MELNQYFISNTSFEVPQDGETLILGNLKIWAHSNLEITEFQSIHGTLVLFGFFMHPDYPKKTNKEILTELSLFVVLSTDFFQYFNQLVGRFVLIVKTENDILVLNDPAGQRQVFYTFRGTDFHCTSSPKLLYDLMEMEFEIPKEKQEIINSKRFRLLEEWFPGDEYLDTNLKRLLPNFFINITEQEIKRIPFRVKDFDPDALKKYVFNQVYGAMQACAFRFDKTLLAVTAGSDSRFILNCLPVDESIEYFIYKRESENDIDLKIATKLSQKKKINLLVIEPGKLSEPFFTFYKKQFLRPRILSKLRNLEWLINNLKNSNTVIIAGYAGEMLRNSTNSINPYHKKFENPEDFIDYLHYPKSEYLENSMNKWWKSLPEYLDNCQNLSPIDLFHWEHHMAPYCAQYAYEQDITEVEIFCPLANRQMILNLIHNTTIEERSAPNGLLYQIINEASPEWKGIPYNPKPFIKMLKNNLFKALPLHIVNKIINR